MFYLRNIYMSRVIRNYKSRMRINLVIKMFTEIIVKRT